MSHKKTYTKTNTPGDNELKIKYYSQQMKWINHQEEMPTYMRELSFQVEKKRNRFPVIFSIQQWPGDHIK